MTDGLLRSRGTIHAVQSIAQAEGLRGFYRGLSPALIGSGVAWGTYFVIYDGIKQRHMTWLQQQRLSPGMHMASAAEAAVVVCLITNPIWLLKTRLQLQQGTPAAQAGASSAGASQAAAMASAATRPPEYRGLLDAISRIAKEEGIRGFYKGLTPALLNTSHGAVQLMVYEELKALALTRSAARSSDPEALQHLSSLEASAYGAVSKLAAAVATYPAQVIRSRLQQRFDGRALVYRTTMEAVRITWTREGFRGFYKGLVANLLRNVPQSAVTFTVYEAVLRMLGS